MEIQDKGRSLREQMSSLVWSEVGVEMAVADKGQTSRPLSPEEPWASSLDRMTSEL